MERPERVMQLFIQIVYGYLACLVGVVWALAAVVSLVYNMLTLRAPELHFGGEPAVTSFEAFRATYAQQGQVAPPQPQPAAADSEPELRRRYRAVRADRARRGRFEAERAILTSAFSLVLGVALSVLHWRWLQRRGAVRVA